MFPFKTWTTAVYLFKTSRLKGRTDLVICFCNNCTLVYSLLFPLPHLTKYAWTPRLAAPLPKVENLTISNITPYGFRVSWEVKQQLQQEEIAPSSGSFSHFQIVVTDSGWLLEPQEFTVPGNQSHLDILGLITGIGYEVRLTGFSESGLLSRPLTTVAVTGTTQCTARTLTAPLSTQPNFVETAANFMIQFWSFTITPWQVFDIQDSRYLTKLAWVSSHLS